MNDVIIALLIGAIAGLLIGFVMAVKIGAGGTVNENHIGKVKTKGDNSPVDADQKMAVPVKKENQKRGIFRKIFTKKIKA